MPPSVRIKVDRMVSAKEFRGIKLAVRAGQLAQRRQVLRC